MNQQAKKAFLTKWVKNLTEQQKDDVIVELMLFAADSEVIVFGDLAPYYEASGEPVVPGQETWSDQYR